MGLFLGQTKEFRTSETYVGDMNDPRFWDSYDMAGYKSSSGITVTPERAKRYITAFSCISLRAQTVASLTALVVQEGDDGRQESINHPLNRLLQGNVNPDTGEYGWFETGVMHLDLWGNAYSIIRRNSDLSVKYLWQVPDPSSVVVTRASKHEQLDDYTRVDPGTIVYEIPDANGKVVRYSAKNILHVANISQNAIVGMSQISIAKEAYGVGLALQEFNGKFFEQGTYPAGALTIDGKLGENRDNFIKGTKAQFAGLGNSHNVLVLEQGAKYAPITMPLKDAQFIESIEATGRQICGFYHVPPHMVGIPNTNSGNNSLEQENAGFRTRCIGPLGERISSTLTRKLLSVDEQENGLKIVFNYDDMLKADLDARGTYLRKMLEIGVPPNSLLAREGFADVGPGGDQSFVPQNLKTLEQAKIMEENAKLTPTVDSPVASVPIGDET